MNRTDRLSLSLSFTIFILLAAACSKRDYRKTEGLIWNTTYHIIYEGVPSLNDSILKTLEEVNRSLNVFDSTSLVSRANLAESIVIDRHFKEVYETSRRINEASDGLFDPTLSPLIKAWGFGQGHKSSADTLKIKEILNYVGIKKTHLSADTLIKDDPRISFNFSAVAKGYGCDAVAEMFKRNGVDNYLVEIGGEISAGGKNPQGKLWKISIDSPIPSDSAIIHDSYAVINVGDAGVATSGNYRNFRKEDGKTVAHTISPLTGRPILSDIASATVIAPTAMEADAAATACMVAGLEKSKEMIRTLNFECILITTDSTVWLSPGMEKYLSE